MDNGFRLSRGFCHIFSDRLVLSNKRETAEVAHLTIGTKNEKNNKPYWILGIGCVVMGTYYFAKEDYYSFLFFELFGMYISYRFYTNKKNHPSPVIARSAIQKVEFDKGISILTSSRFIISYKNDSGELRKRILTLPRSFSQGKMETEKALKLFKEEGLLS